MGGVLATCATVTLILLSYLPTDFSFWCKWILSYIYIALYRLTSKKRFDVYDMNVDHDPCKTNFLPHPIQVVFESPLPETQLESSADEVFFYGVNSKSEYLITRIARGSNGEAEAWIYLKLSNGKIYHLQETSVFHKSGNDNKFFSCGGLQIHYLCPMKRWRIFFNGLLRETCDNDVTTNKMVHVKFAVIWIASSNIYDFATDVNSRALALGLAESEWNQFLPPLEKLYNALNFYAQTGIITGTINVEGNDEEQQLYLFGEKVRFLGEASAKGTEFFHVLGHISKNGRFVHVVEVSIANVVEKFTFGYASSLIGELQSFTDTKSILKNLSDRDKDENDIEAIFQADDEKFILKGTLTGKQRIFKSNQSWADSLTIDCLNFELNALKGRGIVLDGIITKPSSRVRPYSSLYPRPTVIPLVVHFSEKVCQNPDITGGKGSSLGKLTELSNEFRDFKVPSGVVVTTSAYELFTTNEILEEIKKLETVLYSDKVEETKQACQKLVEKITNSSVPDPVLQAIVTSLENAFPDSQDMKFAVRSSATGEDTEQMSAAGQMDTFLGVSGTEEITTALKKCWASQFAFIAIQYKRQNGQIINSPMAVVIQQMVSCDVAGVLFTCDPLTGNPAIMSITANYGLGESVVSGTEEPDTIEIERREDCLIIKNKIIGSKSRRIVLGDDGGTHFEEVSENEKQTCCLADYLIHSLALAALKIERSYGSHRDIEWGFWKYNLYIFQSRPVTSGAGETDYEIEHEFDGPLRIENEYFTVHNVGEVMPGATSPLALELIMKFFDITFERYFFFLDFQKCKRPLYFPRGLAFLLNHGIFYASDLFKNASEDAGSADACAIAVFGRVLEDKEVFDIASERYSKINKNINFMDHLKRFYRMVYGANKILQRATKEINKYYVPTDKCTNSHEVFAQLMYCCTDLTTAFASHMLCSESTSLLNNIIFSILQKAVGEINADVYSDFAKLMTTPSGVESGDVPSAIESLAYYIYKEKKPEEFKKMELDEALKWLETSSSNAGRKYREFLKKHGHRSLREFDIHSLTWETDPRALIRFLQNIIGTVQNDRIEKKDVDFQNQVSNLKAQLTFTQKLLLRIVLPLSQRGVENREQSKSTLMKGLNAWRKGYRKLAKLMVLEGRIPDEDILFFMTLEEIQELLKTRSPKVISKANHRRRRQPVIDKYIFPELTKGFPQPKFIYFFPGIPVSQGVAKGIVRVALDLEEASLLQPGEILVTYCTDIGWSPYFPILGGVVTELGGLISHGAVVSREYGLPCIAGLHGATLHFKTGDYVILDGNKGILQRLSKPEDS
ncbi:putative phosphoenolpyruvate synthase [Nephila pilipes]|uniref:Putative phosphoenolpyruvate synthase n=1 Tax=Nephila pilipes TaxID=299642 RepID=A0A8X6NPK2_NEPPI|nr:putative phosphoenolpyruvate synthase [Nephila pilipes]